MYKTLLLILSFICFSSALSAQNNEKNIEIKSAREEYRYAVGVGNPVMVQQDLTTDYLCTGYRTDVAIVEFYNDKVVRFKLKASLAYTPRDLRESF